MVLDGQHYLYRLYAAAIRQPEWNRFQIAALKHIFAIDARTSTLEEFLEETDQLRVLVEANALDREQYLEKVALLHDDPWMGAMPASAEVPAAIHRLFAALMQLHTFPLDRDRLEADVEQSFRQLRALDPGFEPGEWLLLPRYRRRLPWRPELLHRWLEPLWACAPNAAEPCPASDLGIRGEQWLSGLLPFERPWPDVSPLEVTPIALSLRDQSRWPDPVLHAHDLATAELLRGAATPISLEAVSMERARCRSIVACHNRLELAGLVAPLRAAIAGLPVAPALDVTGLPAAQLLAHPRVRFFLENNLRPNLHTNLDGFGAEDGEAGFDLLLLAQSRPDFDFTRCLERES